VSKLEQVRNFCRKQFSKIDEVKNKKDVRKEGWLKQSDL
jgi:hypothetical protein